MAQYTQTQLKQLADAAARAYWSGSGVDQGEAAGLRAILGDPLMTNTELAEIISQSLGGGLAPNLIQAALAGRDFSTAEDRTRVQQEGLPVFVAPINPPTSTDTSTTIINPTGTDTTTIKPTGTDTSTTTIKPTDTSTTTIKPTGTDTSTTTIAPTTTTIAPTTTTTTTINTVPDWTAYGKSVPGLQAEWEKLKNQFQDPRFPTVESYAQWHYNNIGKNEGRIVPQISMEDFAARAQANAVFQANQPQLLARPAAERGLAAAKAAIAAQPFTKSGLQAALDVGINTALPPNFANFSDAQKVAWANANRVTPTQLASIGLTDANLNYLQSIGYKPPGSTMLAGASTTLPSYVSTATAPTLKTTFDTLDVIQAPRDLGNLGQLAAGNSVIAPVTKNMGGPIAFAEGKEVTAPKEMAKYSLSDFGLPEYVDENYMFTPAVQKVLAGYRESLPRNVVFNPLLETAEREARDKGIDALAERMLMVRQGRTGAEYFPASMFESTAPATMFDERGNRIRPLYQYAEGGGVGRGLGSIAMKGYAEEMAQKGRFGDTMLAHISPEEAQMLQAMGGAGTINPQTGLPEYFSWRKFLKKAGPVLGIAASLFGGPLAGALVGGISGGMGGPGEKFNWKRGLLTGIASYGLGKLGEGLTGAAEAGAPIKDLSTSVGDIGRTAGQLANPIEATMLPGAGAPISAASASIPGAAPGASAMASGLDKIASMTQGAQNVMGNVTGAGEAFKAAAGMTPFQAAATTFLPTMSISGMDEATRQQMQIQAEEDERKKREQQYLQLFAGTLGSVNVASGGEIAAMVAGGATGPANEPRTINGAGDGMSDSVPATIEGVQEARLADGEFVIPADVVADLGNGSSNAGSKKLYAMMDRVRKARHGTTRQPPEVDTDRLMPA